MVVLTLLAVIVFLSTFIEFGKAKNYFSESCKHVTSPKIPVFQVSSIHAALLELLTIFSLTTNYKSFVRKPESTDLDFIHSIKFLTMLLVILGHCILLHSVFPFSNPDFIESVSAI